MLRSTRTRTILPALVTAGMAILALALPGAASALSEIQASQNTRQLPERICRPLTTCLASWSMTVSGAIDLAQGESIRPDRKLVIEMWGDDAFSDDHIDTRTLPLRPLPTTTPRGAGPVGTGICDESRFLGTSDLFYRAGNSLVFRACFSSVKGRGGFNEDRSFIDEGDELLIKIKLVDARGKALRSKTLKTFGIF